VAELAAITIANSSVTDPPEAFKLADKVFKEAEKAYGIHCRIARAFNQLPETFEERGVATKVVTTRSAGKGNGGRRGFAQGTRQTAERPCGVPGCGNTSRYNDEKLGRLCVRHYSIIYTRKRRGAVDPYAGLESVREHKTKDRVTCQVPGCAEKSEQTDCKFGRICNRHAVIRNKRIRLGWADPYLGMASEHMSLATFVPRENAAFWARVRLGVTDAEWVAMWLWARGETPVIGDAILDKARAAALA
jgi:hypothetical protein